MVSDARKGYSWANLLDNSPLPSVSHGANRVTSSDPCRAPRRSRPSRSAGRDHEPDHRRFAFKFQKNVLRRFARTFSIFFQNVGASRGQFFKFKIYVFSPALRAGSFSNFKIRFFFPALRAGGFSKIQTDLALRLGLGPCARDREHGKSMARASE